MNPEQEMRLEALKLKLNGVTTLAAACIRANREFNSKEMWTDGNLEEFYDYIKSGKKPEVTRG